MLPEEAKVVAEYQRRRFNELVDVFDRPQSPEVMVRLAEIVDCAELRPGAVVLNVGNGSRRVDPVDSVVPAIHGVGLRRGGKDVATVHDNYPAVRRCHTDVGRLVANHPEGRAFR